MERLKLKIAVLTSTRADFGIYQPLLEELFIQKDNFYTELIVFGTHLSPFHGYTRSEIDSFIDFPVHEVYGMSLSDTPQAIANAYGNLVSSFSQFWASHTFDWVFALGDRYEMSAAVQAGIPQGVKFAHLHGGETTLGAIDNIYRHQISLASTLHFVATNAFAERVKEITNSDLVYDVGALSLDKLQNLSLPSWSQVKEQFEITTDEFVLCTFHPETVDFGKNEVFSQEASNAIRLLSKEIPIVITLPNADTGGTIFRHAFHQQRVQFSNRIFLIESFGRLNYFTAMQQSAFLLGNSSSGIIEAASFGKYVVNIGDRQKGRPQSDNVINVPFEAQAILVSAHKALKSGNYNGNNIYHKSGTAVNILKHLIDASL